MNPSDKRISCEALDSHFAIKDLAPSDAVDVFCQRTDHRLYHLRSFRSQPKKLPKQRATDSRHLSAHLSFLMLTNPMAILLFTATFSALGIGGWEYAYSSTAILVAGAFVGSALWAPVPAAGVSFFNPRLTRSQLRLADRTAGVILFGFGVAAIIWAFC